MGHLREHTPPERHNRAAKAFGRAAWLAGEVVAETLWPTRCALCDRLGAVLCERCAAGLPHLDWWRACRRCGSPYGLVQCDACNPQTLGRIGRESFPFAGAASAMEFTNATGLIVRTFKDQGEQRLAKVMARSMADALPPSWHADAVTFVPATLAAYRHRGFDHAELVARAFAEAADMPCAPLLARPKTRDQRTLTGRQRVENLTGRFRPLDDARTFADARLVLVDDVFTTGSTLCAATDALLAAGAAEVFALTYARV